jgi:hypothetical protein
MSTLGLRTLTQYWKKPSYCFCCGTLYKQNSRITVFCVPFRERCIDCRNASSSSSSSSRSLYYDWLEVFPKPVLNWVRSSVSSFYFQYNLLASTSSNINSRLLLCHPVTYIHPFTFPLLTCFRRQFIRKKWTIQLALLLVTLSKILLSSFALCVISTRTFLTWSV